MEQWTISSFCISAWWSGFLQWTCITFIMGKINCLKILELWKDEEEASHNQTNPTDSVNLWPRVGEPQALSGSGLWEALWSTGGTCNVFSQEREHGRDGCAAWEACAELTGNPECKWAVVLESEENPGLWQTYGSKNPNSIETSVISNVVHCSLKYRPWTTGGPQKDSKWSLKQFRWCMDMELLCFFFFDLLSIFPVVPKRKS